MITPVHKRSDFPSLLYLPFKVHIHSYISIDLIERGSSGFIKIYGVHAAVLHFTLSLK